MRHNAIDHMAYTLTWGCKLLLGLVEENAKRKHDPKPGQLSDQP